MSGSYSELRIKSSFFFSFCLELPERFFRAIQGSGGVREWLRKFFKDISGCHCCPAKPGKSSSGSSIQSGKKKEFFILSPEWLPLSSMNAAARRRKEAENVPSFSKLFLLQPCLRYPVPFAYRAGKKARIKQGYTPESRIGTPEKPGKNFKKLKIFEKFRSLGAMWWPLWSYTAVLETLNHFKNF